MLQEELSSLEKEVLDVSLWERFVIQLRKEYATICFLKKYLADAKEFLKKKAASLYTEHNSIESEVQETPSSESESFESQKSDSDFEMVDEKESEGSTSDGETSSDRVRTRRSSFLPYEKPEPIITRSRSRKISALRSRAAAKYNSEEESDVQSSSENVTKSVSSQRSDSTAKVVKQEVSSIALFLCRAIKPQSLRTLN